MEVRTFTDAGGIYIYTHTHTFFFLSFQSQECWCRLKQWVKLHHRVFYISLVVQNHTCERQFKTRRITLVHLPPNDISSTKWWIGQTKFRISSLVIKLTWDRSLVVVVVVVSGFILQHCVLMLLILLDFESLRWEVIGCAVRNWMMIECCKPQCAYCLNFVLQRLLVHTQCNTLPSWHNNPAVEVERRGEELSDLWLNASCLWLGSNLVFWIHTAGFNKSYYQPNIVIFLHSGHTVVFLALPPSVASAVTHFRPPIVRYGTAWFSCCVPNHQSALYLPQSFTLTGSGFTRAPDREALWRERPCAWRASGMTYGSVLMGSGEGWPLTSSCIHRQLQVSPQQRWEVTKYQYFDTVLK